MRFVATSVFIMFFCSSVFGNEEQECPNRGTDPSKFCLPGQTWNEEIKKCVNLVWFGVSEITWINLFTQVLWGFVKTIFQKIILRLDSRGIKWINSALQGFLLG